MLVGKRSLLYQTDKIALAEYKGDFDVWGTEDTHPFKGWGNVDYCQMSPEIMDSFETESRRCGIATLNDLLAIKLSHLQYDIFWWKHLQDVLYLRKLLHSQGVFETNNILRFTLEEHWKKEFGGDKPFLSLYKTKDSFFDDFVPKQHEHDYLHILVANDGIPVYSECLKDGQEVFIDKNKFSSLSPHSQVRMFKEEIAVIALERWIIPGLTKSGKRFTIQEAWNKSLHKTITALTKGWASKFIINNIEEMLTPLYEEMLYALSKLNLKEKYMANRVDVEELKEEILKRITVDTNSWVFRNVNMEDEEAVQEAKEDYLSDYWDDLLLGDVGDDDIEGFEFLEQDGGGEGGSESCYSVFRLDDKVYKATYSYYSHHGFDFDYLHIYEVQPKQKTITVYE